MGVVRREGDWRLEKVKQGAYEITYQREPQIKILTPDYQEDQLSGSFDMLPVHEVDSYAEAKGLFEEKAHGPAPFGMSGGGGFLDDSTSGESLFDGTTSSGSNRDSEDFDAPPGVIAIALIIVGGILVFSEGIAPNSTLFQIGTVFMVVGFGIVGWGGYIGRKHGLSEAIEVLFETKSSSIPSGSRDTTEKTPPAPENLKNELIFDRANHHCEWCGDRYDNLHVHHIEPRREGGANTKRNLIALCPNCHDRADRGGISKSKLKGKVRRIMAD